MLGTFHPPREIYCCTDFLGTLSKDDIKSGIGEILHYYLIDNSRLIEELNNSYDKLIANPSVSLKKFILESLRIKKDMIEKDEFDKDQRRVFNYGHTFGHAIEAISEYEISHGIAVTLGMDLANYISLKMGFIDRETFSALHQSLKNNLPTYRLSEDLLEGYFALLARDKKNIDDSLVCILPYGIGDIRVTKIDNLETTKNLVREYMEN